MRDNQSTRTVGERGPRPRWKTISSSRKSLISTAKRIPERVVHARGAGAHGYFEAYGKIGQRASVEIHPCPASSPRPGSRPRCSCVSPPWRGPRNHPETERDPRGFAVKFKTVDGNWDLVGNNLKVFFIRDAIKFPDMIHAFKPDPVTNRQEAWRFFDFVGMHPESLHMVTHLKSPWGNPGQLPGNGGLGRQYLQARQRRGGGAPLQIPLDAQAGRPELDDRTSPRDPGQGRRPCDARPLRQHRERQLSRVGIRGADHAGRSERPPLLRSARRYQNFGRWISFRCFPAAAWCSTARPPTSSRRWSSRRSARVCWSTASTSPTTRCFRGEPSATRIRNATGSVPIICSCPSTRRVRASAR